MRRMIPLVVAALSIAAPALAQTTDPIAKALLAAPMNLREAATVVKWNTTDYTYETLKKGTNALVCYDRSGAPLQQPFSVECTMLANLPRVAQSMKFESGGDRAKRDALVAAAEKDGTRVKPEFGSVFYNLNGAAEAQAHPHSTIAVPGATTATLGLPQDGKSGGVWIMNAGTTTAHLMVPGE